MVNETEPTQEFLQVTPQASILESELEAALSVTQCMVEPERMLARLR
jgi:hypothetical protein